MSRTLVAYKEKDYIGLLARTQVSGGPYTMKDGVKNSKEVAAFFSSMILAQGADRVKLQKFVGSEVVPVDKAFIEEIMLGKNAFTEYTKSGKTVALFEWYGDDGADLKLYRASKASVEKAAKKAGFKLEWGSRPAGIEA
jgi:hypothetical protein